MHHLLGGAAHHLLAQQMVLHGSTCTTWAAGNPHSSAVGSIKAWNTPSLCIVTYWLCAMTCTSAGSPVVARL
jgi:hypothetical protein